MGVGSLTAVTGLVAKTYFGSTLSQYILYFLVLGAGVVVGRILYYGIELHVQHRAAGTANQFDDIVVDSLGKPVMLLSLAVAATLGKPVLSPAAGAAEVLSIGTQILLYAGGAWMATRFIGAAIETYFERYASRTDSKLDDQFGPILRRIAKVSIVSITFIMMLDSFGYDVKAVLASLGIGGLAVAFAAKQTIADAFGGFNILTARPFVVGDNVEIGDVSGTVEEIGLRFTRIRDFDGRKITMPNSDVASAVITNISSEPTRRVLSYIGLTYDTTAEELQQAIDVTESAVNSVDGVDTEQTEAWFWEYGDSAQVLRVQYHITDLENKFVVKTAVNTAIKAAYEEHGFDMAFPTQTIHVVGDAATEEQELRGARLPE